MIFVPKILKLSDIVLEKPTILNFNQKKVYKSDKKLDLMFKPGEIWVFCICPR